MVGLRVIRAFQSTVGMIRCFQTFHALVECPILLEYEGTSAHICGVDYEREVKVPRKKAFQLEKTKSSSQLCKSSSHVDEGHQASQRFFRASQ